MNGLELPEIARHIKDPIHDYIPIHSKLAKFIDTRQFQRLRSIKQLGTSSYVWPGASHSRFEHCIGVAYLARLLVEQIQKNQPSLGISTRDVECVEIAALCHDLGHGPWSHVWDGMFIPIALRGRKQWRHEDGSEMMFDYLVRDNDIHIPIEDQLFIKAIIAGEPERCSTDEKPFLFDIVANKRNGLDVDKFDYIQRDSHMVGDPIHISVHRLIKSARVLDNQICYDIKDANQIYEICATRFKLHKIIYNHKVAKAIEYMIIDALLAAEPHLHFAEHVYVPEKYIYLTDAILERIESSERDDLTPARTIIDRIRTRDLYKCVDYKVIDWPYKSLFEREMTSERIVEAAKRVAGNRARAVADNDKHKNGDVADENGEDDPAWIASVVDSLEAKDVIVDFSSMHYGMKDKNPLDFVKFYSKRNPNTCANACRGDYSVLMPDIFAEVLLRVYTKDVQYFGIIQAGYRAVLQTITIPSFSPGLAPVELAPATLLFSEPDCDDPSDTKPKPKPRLGAPRTPSVKLPPARTTAAVLTPPAEVPSTPPYTGGSTGRRGFSRTASFSNNSFTTVSANYVPPMSPSRRGKKRGRVASGDWGASGKGDADADADVDPLSLEKSGSPPRKKPRSSGAAE